MNSQNDKKTWEVPELSEYGSIEELTGQQDKKLGPSDGYTFQGVPIADNS